MNIVIEDEELYKLSEMGFSNRKIEEYFHEKGIEITAQTIKKRLTRIYEGKRKTKLGFETLNEEIYEMRENGFTYREIAKHFNEKGIIISSTTIANICKRIYEEKGKEEPKCSPIINQYNDRIFNLREQRFQYSEIKRELKQNGINISASTISERCKEIYIDKGKEQPKISSKLDREISDEEIYTLRENNLSYVDIELYFFYEKGISISASTIRTRCKEIYAEKGEEEPKFKGGRRDKEMDKISNKQLAQAILNLAVTRKATVDQIKTIAEYYQVDLEKVFEDVEER